MAYNRVSFIVVCGLHLTLVSSDVSAFEWSFPGFHNITLPSWPDQLQSIWDQAWEQHKDRISFCTGGSTSAVTQLLKDSFPLPLPAGPSDDLICANPAVISAHLCGPQEAMVYMKFLLLTDNIEKIPSNAFCEVGSEAPACAPGFFQTLNLSHTLQDPTATAPVKPHACCPGYFCPGMLACMLPCPLGAYCPRAWAADPPASYTEHNLEISKQLLHKTDKWCAPYAYKMRPALGCGGADKWTIQPSGAFPTEGWYAGSGSLYCEGGSYCPDPTTKLPCKEGYYCKQGSSKMTACPPLVSCPTGTEAPTDNWLGLVLDGCMFLLLGLLWHISQVYNRLMRRLSNRERVRIMWHKTHPEVTIVQVADARQLDWQHPPHPPAAELASNTAPEPVTAPQAVPVPRASPPTRLAFLRSFTRRRSQGGGGQATAAAVGPVWASIEGREGSQRSPLLEFEMLSEERRSSTHPGQQQHSRSLSGIPLVENTTFTLPPVNLQSQKTKATHSASHNSDSDGDLVLAGNYQIATAEQQEGAARMRDTADGRVILGITGCYKPVMDVGFQGLSMKLKSCGKQVLQNVTGQLLHGRLTAIMGPSGAGKTTLMTALAGKASYGVVSGSVTINGRCDSIERWKCLMGFVPQDDIMYRNLTVEENLTYSAMFRLPGSTSHVQLLEVVTSAVSMLGLADVRHSLIGDEQVRGISGGQRKRVNVGLELVADPSLLFLDEPTSGLDSTASKLVVQGLRCVADSGVTVAAVIHQPSYETFCMFEDLVLLSKGGLTAYCGPQNGVRGYFEGLGFDIPQHMNPADAFLDIISGTILPISGATVDIPGSWKDRQSSNAEATVRQAAAVQRLSDPNGLQISEDEPDSALLRHGSGSQRIVGDVLGGAVASGTAAECVGVSEVAGFELQPAALRGRLLKAVTLWCALVGVAAHEAVTSCFQALHGAVAGACSAVRQTTASIRNSLADRLQSWAAVVASDSQSNDASSSYRRISSGSDRHDGRSPRGVGSAVSSRSSRRQPPGFFKQFYWVMTRALLMRTRQPVLVLIEYMIFALTGSFLGMMSDRGRGSIGSYVGNVVYSLVALGMLATVSGLSMFGTDRQVYYREAAAGLNKLAYFWALDAWGHAGMLLRSSVYLIMYYTFSQPRAVVWQMYFVTCAIYYSCTGMAYLLSQVMSPSAAQLTAAVTALINALMASKFATSGVMGFLNTISYARWGLEGYVIAEANRLTGVWLLARCADLAAFHYDVTRFWYAIKVLFYIGFGTRLAACLGLLTLHRDKTL